MKQAKNNLLVCYRYSIGSSFCHMRRIATARRETHEQRKHERAADAVTKRGRLAGLWPEQEQEPRRLLLREFVCVRVRAFVRVCVCI